MEIYAVKDINKKRLEKNEIKFCPKNDKDEKNKLINKIIIMKPPVRIIQPNNIGIENINVPAKLDLIAFAIPY